VSELGIGGIGGTQYLECRLGRGHAQVDYLCAISRSSSAAFFETLTTYASARATAEGPGWREVLGLLDRWRHGESPITPTAPGIWLEFDDVAGDARHSARPSVSVGLVANYRFGRPLNPTVVERDLGVARDALRAVGVGVSEPMGASLSRCFASLPPSGRWIHLSVMLGRDPSAIKLYGVMSREALLPYLRTIGWRGDEDALSRLLAGAYGPDLVGDEVFLDLNLENFRDPERCSLGLAVAQQHVVRGPDPDPRRRRVLERWVSLGFAERSRAEEILEALGDRVDVLHPGGRFLDLKLVWQAGGAVTAKAYLGSHRGGRMVF
jgi:hypothetical protein